MRFLLPAERLLLAGRREDDDEIRDVGVADEVLRAVQHEVAAVAAAPCIFMRAHVGARVRLRHRQRVDLLAADRRQEIALALLALAGHQDVGRPAEMHRQPPAGPARARAPAA